MISRLLRSGQRKTTAARKKHDKLAAIREVDRRLFKEYMLSKAAKYSIKIWTACDAKFNSERQREKHLKGMRIVTDLTKGLKGCNVTCDNFFTSYQLAVELRKRKLPVLGTIIKDKGVLPQELLVMCGKQR
ncbi:conserved hypothetical protein [Trichinella spiralis]|nr:conserved hypothetical protein [Trichinella spiralis]